VPGEPLVISVLPFGGAVVDGIGVLFPPAIPVPSDPGHPDKFEVIVTYPPIAVGIVRLQALAFTPVGLFAISNAVNILAGPNPAEVSLMPGLVPIGAFPALDEGWAGPLPTPPGFMFYGLPAPVCHVNTNGFIDFTPGPPLPIADFTGSAGDLGCPLPTLSASPRFAINHFVLDLAIPAVAPRVTDLTMEFAPPGPVTPSRLIIRWKHVATFGSPFGSPIANRASFVAELWGSDSLIGWSRLVGVRQENLSITSLANHDMIGIGPGPAAAGMGGPPPVCTSLAMWPLYGTPGFFSLPFEAMFMDTAPIVPGLVDSAMLSNLAVAFTPIPGAIGPYILTVH
jgi:hypothetical protein